MAMDRHLVQSLLEESLASPKDERMVLVRQQRVRRLLADVGISAPDWRFAQEASALADVAKDLIPPFVLKAVGPRLTHKSDVGAVMLGLPNVEAVVREAELMLDRLRAQDIQPEGFVVEETVGRGLELIVGAANVAGFGPVFMLGLGGIYAEMLRDVRFHLGPVGPDDVRTMASRLGASTGFTGVRGLPAVALDDLCDVCVKISALAMRLGPALGEFEINPLTASAGGLRAVDSRLVLRSAVRSELAESDADTNSLGKPPRGSYADLEKAFFPESIAVAGASPSRLNMGSAYLQQYVECGYPGKLFAIHPDAPSVGGIPAFPSVGEIPQHVDYLVVAVPADAAASVVQQSGGRVSFAHVLSSGFAELGDDKGRERQERLLAAAQEARVRVLGPNSRGIYCPRGKVTMEGDLSCEAGHTGVVSQSGGLLSDIITWGEERGIRFSKAVSAGNCIDVSIPELTAYLLGDPDTATLGMYVEDATHAWELAEVLRTTGAHKRRVLLVGGTTPEGQAAAASHTAAMAGSEALWDAFAGQCKMARASTLEGFLDMLLMSQLHAERNVGPADRVFVVGPGGGPTVLMSDYLARHGRRLVPMPEEFVKAVKAGSLHFGPGTVIRNPLDLGTSVLSEMAPGEFTTLLESVVRMATPSDLIVHLDTPKFLKAGLTRGRDGTEVLLRLVGDVAELQRSHRDVRVALVLRGEMSRPAVGELRRKALSMAAAQMVPVVSRLQDAAAALEVFS